MKIGVLTFHFAYNYGAMLQAYALSRFLNNLKDVKCEIVDYRPRKIDYLYHPDIIDFCQHPKTILRNYFNRKLSKADSREFERFINERFALSKRVRNDKDFHTIVSQYDMLFVGSDQVWNPVITGADKNYLFWNIPDTIRKNSYAASFGTNSLADDWKAELRKALGNFQNISVREQGGCFLLESILLEKKIEVISDPVFLLKLEEWREIARTVDSPDKFILFYSLNGSRDLEIQTEKLAQQEGIKIVSVHPLFKPKLGEGRCDIGPELFLGLIDKAEYVCTDSFHATAFSIIFRKRILVKYDRERGNRIANLFNMLKITLDESENLIGRYDFSLLNNYEANKLHKCGRRYIEECCGEEKRIN